MQQSSVPKRARLLTEEQLIKAESLATYSREAEATLILCAVHNPHVALRIVADLDEVDFADDRTRATFRAVKALVDRGVRVTRPALKEKLEVAGDMEVVGYEDFDVMTDGVPAHNAAPWALDRVTEASSRRQLLRAAREIASFALDMEREHPANDAFGALMAVNEKRADETVRHVSEVFKAQVMNIQAAHEANKAGAPPVAQTGFPDIDNRVILGPGKLAILAARPGMAKTQLAWAIANNVAKDRLVVFTTLEMEGEELAGRQIVTDLRISSHDQATGRVHDAEWDKLYALPGRYADLKLYIDDTPATNMAGIEATSRRAAARQGEKLGLLVIDYLGLVDAEGKDDTAKTSKISREAKRLAKKMKCPVLLLSQLSRKVEERPNKRPLLSDLRQSGSIEQDANIVMFIYRDEYYDPETKERGIAEVIIAKNREGPAGVTAKLLWRPEEMRFEPIPFAMSFMGGEQHDD